MVDFNKRSERNDITIQKRQLTIPAVFVDGHTCTANEAAALNQLLAENVRNNMAKKVSDLAEKKASDEDIQAAVDAYVAEYVFGVRRGGSGRTGDPVETKAMELATAKIKTAIRQKNLKIKDVGVEQIAKMAKDALEKYPNIREQAKQIVAMQDQALGGLDDIEVPAK